MTVKTTAGPVELARPKLRGTSEAFASRLFGAHVTKTNALETPVIASFVRGLSVRDVEATLADTLGDQAAVSKSTVSTICQQIKDEYQAWARRCLDEVKLDYLFLDASFFRTHPGSPAEPVLAAWGITTDGKPAFIAWHPAPASPSTPGRTSSPACATAACPPAADHLRRGGRADRRDRADLPQSAASKVPCPSREKHPRQGPCWDAGRGQGHLLEDLRHQRPGHRPGPKLVEIIDNRIREMAAKYSATYPSAMKCLTTDAEGLTAYLRFPAEHYNRVRHSNFIERTFGETRRKVKVIGRLPGETSCLILVWAVLDRASRGWRGFTMTAEGLRLLQDLRRSLLEPPRRLHRHSPPEVSGEPRAAGTVA